MKDKLRTISYLFCPHYSLFLVHLESGSESSFMILKNELKLNENFILFIVGITLVTFLFS